MSMRAGKQMLKRRGWRYFERSSTGDIKPICLTMLHVPSRERTRRCSNWKRIIVVSGFTKTHAIPNLLHRMHKGQSISPLRQCTPRGRPADNARDVVSRGVGLTCTEDCTLRPPRGMTDMLY